MSNGTRTLICGAGEVGKGLAKVLEMYNPILKDIEDIDYKDVDYLHICFPYSKGFIKEVKRLRKLYKPRYTIIHSTVPVGTTFRCGSKVLFSPIRGRHPHLAEGIKLFTKGLAGFEANEVAPYFENAGIKINIFASINSLEYAKIMCTTRLGLDVIYMRQIMKDCDKYDWEFDKVYTDWTNEYNAGYDTLEERHFHRPVLKPMKQKISGHCVIPNLSLLNNWITKLVKKMDNIL